MSFDYTIAPSSGHVKVIGTGAITTSDCIQIIDRVMSDPRCCPDSTGLIDLRNAIYHPDDEAEIINIAKEMESFQAKLHNKIAVVARRATLLTAELFSVHVRTTTNVHIRVFTDFSAAEAFCGVASTPP